MEEADGALTDHDDGLTDERGEAAAAEDDGAELLRHEQVLFGHVAGELEQEVRLDELVAGEGAGAPDVGRSEHEVAGLELRASTVDDLAESLVAGVAVGQRELVGVPAHVDDVEVASAYGSEAGPDQDLALLGVGHGDVVAVDALQVGGQGGGHVGHGTGAPGGSVGMGAFSMRGAWAVKLGALHAMQNGRRVLYNVKT